MENYEQKYKEALERARKINSGEGVASSPDWTTCETIFPELKESEDKRIRRFVIHELACLRAGEFVDEETSDRYKELSNAISWLEKQGEKSWSEEDNKNLNSVKWIIENSENLNKVFETIDSPEYIKKYFIDWLKSLKPRWKPTKEQMIDLYYAAMQLSVTRQHLQSLYNDLKSL